MIHLNKEKHPLLIQRIIKNLSWFFKVLKQGWCIICVFLISVYSMDRYFGVIIEVWLMILYTLGLKQWISFWCVTLSFHWIKMNRMGGPSYNRRYEVNRTRLSHIKWLYFIAKFSSIREKLGNQNVIRDYTICKKCIFINEGRWHIKSRRTRLSKSVTLRKVKRDHTVHV